ncbi:MAG: hypothetical protein EXS42_06865 [Lacunisphaera sp.]|nr:hypothetical protein [Lacunisphaera sp.]
MPPPPLLLIILLIILLIGGFLMWLRWLSGPTNTVGINNVLVSVTPGQLTAGSTQRFTVTVTAFGYSDTVTPRNVNIKLLDRDPFWNDLLDEYTTATASAAGIAPTPDPSGVSPLYTWTFPTPSSCGAMPSAAWPARWTTAGKVTRSFLPASG